MALRDFPGAGVEVVTRRFVPDREPVTVEPHLPGGGPPDLVGGGGQGGMTDSRDLAEMGSQGGISGSRVLR
jgi:hypothetical protein